jgi:hypothetical protein
MFYDDDRPSISLFSQRNKTTAKKEGPHEQQSFTTEISLLNTLPIFFSALGKEAIYRVSHKKLSVKENIRRRVSLLIVLFLTLGKEL